MTAINGRPHQGRPVIAIDGTESIEGRALFTISALYWCLDLLPRVDLRLIDVADENVALALELLRSQHGVEAEVCPVHEHSSPLAGASLYAAVAFRSADHLRIAEARDARLPTLLAIQFPDAEWLLPSVVLRQRSAFDPRCFADDLRSVVMPWLA